MRNMVYFILKLLNCVDENTKMSSDQTKMFKTNLKILKICAIWPGRNPSQYYKYFSFPFLFITFFVYNILLTLSLVYTPRKIEVFIREVIFYFTEITVSTKILTMLLLDHKINEAFDIIDSKDFLGDYGVKDGIISKASAGYRMGWKIYVYSAHVAYSLLLLDIIRGSQLRLPVCQFYFLTDELRESYFFYWFIYQAFGIYIHMLYNIHFDSLLAGLIVMPIVQLRILNVRLTNFKLSKEERKLSLEIQDKIQVHKLKNLVKQYNVILRYCLVLQDIVGPTLFFQFGVATFIICVVLSGLLLLESTTESLGFLVLYFMTMTLQIFIPGYLGTRLTYESTDVMVAAYHSEWIPRSELFKKNLRLLIERAKTPIILSGLKLFPLSLSSFTTIVKTAYSFFTLIRNFQEQ